MTRILILFFLLSLTSCVDGRDGKFFICGVTEKCK